MTRNQLAAKILISRSANPNVAQPVELQVLAAAQIADAFLNFIINEQKRDGDDEIIKELESKK